MALTAIAVEKLPKRAARYEVPDGKVIGLSLVVQPTGTKSWAVRYRRDGRSRKLTLGAFPTIGLDDARKLANRALRLVAEGNDPAFDKVEARRKVQAGVGDEQTFSDAWDRYLKEYVKPNLKPRTAHELERLFKTLILPKFKRRRLKEVQPYDIKGICTAQITRGAPSQASHVFVALRQFFNWCVEHVILEKNPCDGLKQPKASEARERVLTDQEIKWFWKACGEIGYPFGPMNRLLLLTGARRDEIRSLTEREIDKAAHVITLPGKRTKNKREHVIYLSDLARDVLKFPRVKNTHGWLFTTTGETAVSGFSRAKAILDAKMKEYADEAGSVIDPWVIHDLRRTAASGMARLGITLPAIERCLNHISGSFAGIVGVYQRHEFAPEKQAAFEVWGDYIAGLVKD